MHTLIKTFFLIIVFPIMLSAMQEPFADEIEKGEAQKEDNIIVSEEKILEDLEKIHQQVNEFWKKLNSDKRNKLTKSI